MRFSMAGMGVALVWLATASASRAQTPGTAAPPDPGVSPSELERLQQSLTADSPEPTAPTRAAAPATGVAGGPQSLNPDLALILDVAGAYFNEKPLPGGGHDPNHTGFTFQQLELAAGASVDPYLRFDTNIVFAQFGVEVEEAYVTTLSLPGNLQARAGQFLTRFGRLNASHPHFWNFTDQPLILGKFFGAEGNRGLGGELSWLSPLPWYVELVGSVNDVAGECCARSYFGAEGSGVRHPGDLLYTTALKQFFALSDPWSLLWGLSAQFGPNPTGPYNRTEIYGTDLLLRWRPVTGDTRRSVSLQTEWLYRARQVPDDSLRDWGGYAHLVWGINANWETGARYEVGTGITSDPLDPQWDARRQKASAQTTFRPSHFARLRLQFNYDVPGWLPEAHWGVIFNLEVVAGAHGAHAY